MRKSSRFLCLTGAILLASVVGCKSSCCSNGTCGPNQGMSGPISSGTAYPSPTTTGAAGAGAMQSPFSTSSSSYPGMSGGQANYPAPTTSSTMYPGMSGAH